MSVCVHARARVCVEVDGYIMKTYISVFAHFWLCTDAYMQTDLYVYIPIVPRLLRVRWRVCSERTRTEVYERHHYPRERRAGLPN